VEASANHSRWWPKRWSETFYSELKHNAAPNIRAVVSEVHVDNIPMQRLNASLGAICKLDPEDPDYLICTILVSSD
jgi:hypothetical protein